MSNVIDFKAAREKLDPDYEELDPEQEALYEAISMTINMVEYLDESELYLEDDPKSMGDIYLIIDIIHALLTRLQKIPTESQKVSETIVQITDYEDHLKRFRDTMNDD